MESWLYTSYLVYTICMLTIKAPLTMLKGENNFWKSADTVLIPEEM